ncbi:membrane protein [soil metagenome]
MCNFSRILLGIMFLFSGFQAAAQSVASSPFSRLGIGEINSGTSSIRNLSMGGVGVATPNSAMINDINPALLFYNNLVTFEIGVAGEGKRIANQSQTQTVGDANLGYLALALPINRRWSAVLGLRSFSNVDYQNYSLQPVENNNGAQVVKSYEGQGGLSEAFFGHGVKIAKGLSVGATGSFIFGNIFNDAGTLLTNANDPTLGGERTVFSTRTTYADLMFKGGAHYRHSFKDKVFLSLGGVYGLQSDLSGTRRTVLHRRNAASDALMEETVLEDSIQGHVHIPQTLSVGLGLDNGKNWVIGLDFSAQNMSQFRSFEGRQDLGDTYRVGLGGEITPDMMSTDSFLKRVTYRLGFNYGRTPWLIDGNALDDMSFSWGVSLPAGRMSALQRSFLNLGFTVGQRGSLGSNSIRETYARFQVGLALNNRWFIKRMVD